MPDSELFELISENRSMSRKLEEYGQQKSTSISTAKRLAEFLGDQMVKDAGLACKYIISRKPEGAPVTERAIPLAIFQSESAVRRHYLRRWLKDSSIDGDIDIRQILDWNYYIERIGGTIQKIITIPAALQGISNPVPRVQHPDWLHKKMLEKNDVFKQRKIDDIFKAKPKPICDIEDTVGPSTSTSLNVPVVTRKRVRPEEEENQPKTWREALGNPPDVGTTREELVEWIKFQKKKWRWQLAERRKNRGINDNKKGRHDEIPLRDGPAQREQFTTLGGFLRRTQRNLIEMPWHVIQVSQGDQDGHFNVWAMVGEELQKIKLEVPRVFYVNQRTLAPPCEENEDKISWMKVSRTLPRSRPVFNLYQYIIPEKVFRDNRLEILVDLAAPDIEGIYETQMSLESRALIHLGNICSVVRSEAKKIAAQAGAKDSFSLFQMEQKTSKQIHPYLYNNENLRKIFLYQHAIPSGKKSVWGLFLTPINKAFIFVHDSVRTNQIPSLRNLYHTEHQHCLQDDEKLNEILPPTEIEFESHVETDLKMVRNQSNRDFLN